jgi:XTP/dITP diphosphohydrolase
VGENGFGYDPIFSPDGYSISSAQMSAADKDAISHRGKALRAIAPHVRKMVAELG